MMEDVDKPPHVSEPTEEMKMMKKILNWCYDHTFINKMRGSKGPKDKLLHYACKEGLLPIVEMLLEENRFENIDCLGEKGQTPLHEAASKSHYEIVKILVDKDANVNAKSDNGSTPLHNISAKSGTNALKITQLLIEKGSDVNAKTNTKITPLHNVSTQSGENALEMAKLLIEKGADIHSKTHYYNSTCLQYAASRNNSSEMTKLLMSKGAFTNSKDPEMVKACYEAIINGNLEIVQLFMEKDVDIINYNYKGNSYSGPPICAAAQSGNLEICKLLLEHGANINELTLGGETVLHRASSLKYSYRNETNYIDVVKFFIEKGVNVNIQDKLGYTALHVLIHYSNNHIWKKEILELGKLLIENGANTNLQNTSSGETPLHITRVKEMADILLKNGAKTDIKNVKGKTPKDTSKRMRAHEVTKLIVEHENQQRTGQAELNECIICFEPKDGTFAFLPCGHAKTCEKCCKNIMKPTNSNPECPTCRQPVSLYQKIFI